MTTPTYSTSVVPYQFVNGAVHINAALVPFLEHEDWIHANRVGSMLFSHQTAAVFRHGSDEPDNAVCAFSLPQLNYWIAKELSERGDLNDTDMGAFITNIAKACVPYGVVSSSDYRATRHRQTAVLQQGQTRLVDYWNGEATYGDHLWFALVQMSLTDVAGKLAPSVDVGVMNPFPSDTDFANRSTPQFRAVVTSSPSFVWSEDSCRMGRCNVLCVYYVGMCTERFRQRQRPRSSQAWASPTAVSADALRKASTIEVNVDMLAKFDFLSLPVYAA
jgi:hypothetical protein